MRTSALFSAKTSNFSKFMVSPHKQGEMGGWGGLNQCGHFTDKGESIFRDFVFYERPLTRNCTTF